MTSLANATSEGIVSDKASAHVSTLSLVVRAIPACQTTLGWTALPSASLLLIAVVMDSAATTVNALAVKRSQGPIA